MSPAKNALDELSQDPATRRRARERADAIKLYEIDLIASRIEGEAKGEVKGKAKLLLELLELRFGPPSAATQARLETATPEELDTFAERVLSAKTLQEVLAPGR